MLIAIKLVPPVSLSSLSEQLTTKKIHGETVDVDFNIYEGGTNNEDKDYLIVEVDHLVYDVSTAAITPEGTLTITPIVL